MEEGEEQEQQEEREEEEEEKEEVDGRELGSPVLSESTEASSDLEGENGDFRYSEVLDMTKGSNGVEGKAEDSDFGTAFDILFNGNSSTATLQRQLFNGDGDSFSLEQCMDAEALAKVVEGYVRRLLVYNSNGPIPWFKFERLLGSGTYAGCYLVGPKQGYRKWRVLKAVRLFPVEAARFTARGAVAEAQALASLTVANVQNVVKMKWMALWKGWMLTALEYAEDGILEKEAWKKNASDPVRGTRKWQEWVQRREVRCLDVARVLLRVVEDLYSRGYMHRDLKPANILVRGDGSVCVADFNMCYKRKGWVGPGAVEGVEEEEGGKGDGSGRWYATGWAGTPLFVAPEVLGGGWYDEKSDVYSVGKILVHLFKGVEYLEHAYVSNIPPLEVGMSMEGWTKEGQICLARMLAEDPEQRPSLAELERDWAPAVGGVFLGKVASPRELEGQAKKEMEWQVRRKMELQVTEKGLIEAAKIWGVGPWPAEWERPLEGLEVERMRARPWRVIQWEMMEEEAEQMRKEAEEERASDGARAAFLEQRKH